MELSRREWLTASAFVLASPKAALVAAATNASGSSAQPIVLCWNENPYGPSPAARAILNGTIPIACRYPDEEIEQLTAVLARKEKPCCPIGSSLRLTPEFTESFFIAC